MATAFLVLATALLVLLISRLKEIHIVLSGSEGRGENNKSPRLADGPPKVEGGREEQGKLED